VTQDITNLCLSQFQVLNFATKYKVKDYRLSWYSEYLKKFNRNMFHLGVFYLICL
jgi:hypothetical protein